MIESMLLNRALMTGVMQFEDRHDHYRLVVKALGLTITLARLTKKEAQEALKPKLEVVK